MTEEPAEEARVSQAALLLAEVVASLPADHVDDLRRMLGHELADQPMPERRFMRLGLLMELARDGNGDFVALGDYNAARAVRGQQGEQWPAGSTLANAYGDWTRAVAAAMAVASPAAWKQRPSVSKAHREGNKPTFAMREVVDAIHRARDQLGVWPYASEFHSWGRISRELAGRAGRPHVRIPTAKAINKRFGSYEQAVAVAKRLDRNSH